MPAREIRGESHSFEFAGLQAGIASAPEGTHARPGGASGTTSASQLCKTPDDLVSPRARSAMATWIRRQQKCSGGSSDAALKVSKTKLMGASRCGEFEPRSPAS